MQKSSESHGTRQQLQERLARLSGDEFKVAAYLRDQLEKANGHIVLLKDENLAASTGLSMRQVATARKSLVNRGLVQSEPVRGRGTIFRPAAPDSVSNEVTVVASQPVETVVSPTGPELNPVTSVGTVNEQVKDRAAVLVSEDARKQHGSFRQKPQESTPAVGTAKPVETDGPATVPVPPPVARVGTVNEQTGVLVAKMMDTMPDRSYLQKLQELAGGPDLLLECLQWMVDQVDSRLGIPRYRFSADGRDLVASCIAHLCRSPDSPFLTGRHVKE